LNADVNRPFRYLVIFVQYFFAGHALFSGTNHFVLFVTEAKPLHPIAGPFVDSLMAMGLFDVVKIIEIAVAICLLFNRFVPLALLVELPITVIISWTSLVVVHSPRSIFTGTRELLFNAFLMAVYFGYYRALLTFKARQQPLWDAGAWQAGSGQK
jgi:hypothetical protein